MKQEEQSYEDTFYGGSRSSHVDVDDIGEQPRSRNIKQSIT